MNKGAVPKEPISYVVEQELPRGFVVISDVKTVDFEYTAPDLMNPANSAVIQSKGTKSKVFFTWTKTNFTSGYEIQISTSRDFSSLYLKKLVKDNVLLLVSIPQGEYFWRVRAFSSKKLSPYSAVRALSIQ